MTNPFLKLAQQGKNEVYHYGFGLFVIFFCWLILGALPFQLLTSAGLVSSAQPLLYFAVLNSSFWLLIVGLFLAVRLVHKRPFLTLITPLNQIDWRRFGQGFLLYFALIAIGALVEYLITPEIYTFTLNWTQFVPFLLLMILLIPIQTSAEEFLFRGYLLQATGQIIQNEWVLAIINGLLFMLPHLGNPEVASAPVLLALFFFGIGAFLALITLKDQKLELALGAHCANNLFTGIFVNYSNSVLQTESVFLISELNALYSLIAMLVSAVLFYWILNLGKS